MTLYDGRPYAELTIAARCGYPVALRERTVDEHVDAILERWDTDADGPPDADLVRAEAERTACPPCARSWVPGQACMTCSFADLTITDWSAPANPIGFQH